MPLYLALAPWVLVFFAGACLYSFLNVVICRTQRGSSFIRGRSRCESCGHALSPLDLVPLLSWLFLRGRCRYCGARVSPRYVLMEALGSGLALLCTAVFGFTLEALLVFLLLCALTICGFTVYDTGALPAWALICVALPAAALLFSAKETLTWDIPGGSALCALPALALRAARKASVSQTEMLLAAVCGSVLGLWGGLAALLLSAMTAGIFRLAWRNKLPRFSPCWCCGTAAAMLLHVALQHTPGL